VPNIGHLLEVYPLLLGRVIPLRVSGRAIGHLLGRGALRRDIAVYRGSGKRGNRPEQEIEYLRHLLAETGSKAIKFRLGGRMSRNADSLPGRTEALIPLVRETFGDDAMTLYADANSSYDEGRAHGGGGRAALHAARGSASTSPPTTSASSSASTPDAPIAGSVRICANDRVHLL
jgi:hypothetical protein